MKRGVGHRVARAVVGLTSGAVAIALVVHAAPVVRAEYGRLAVADLETAVREQQKLSSGQLETLASVLKDSYAHRGAPATIQDLALVQMLLREQTGAESPGLDKIAARLGEGLSARPAAPHAWARLARVQFEQDRDGSVVRDSLILAITTGPTVRRLSVPRLEIGLRLWDRLDAYERGLVRRQARLAFRHDAEATVRVALAAGNVSVVRSELSSLSAQARFDALVANREG